MSLLQKLGMAVIGTYMTLGISGCEEESKTEFSQENIGIYQGEIKGREAQMKIFPYDKKGISCYLTIFGNGSLRISSDTSGNCEVREICFVSLEGINRRSCYYAKELEVVGELEYFQQLMDEGKRLLVRPENNSLKKKIRDEIVEFWK